MSKRRDSSSVRRIATLVLAILLLAGLLWLLATNYRAGLALLAGVAGMFFLLGIARVIRTRLSRRGRRLLVGFGAVAFIAVAGLAGLSALSLRGETAAPQGVQPDSDEPTESEAPGISDSVRAEIRAYRVFVEPTTARDTFSVREELVYDVLVNEQVSLADQLIQYPAREATSEPRGFMLHELVIMPFGTGPYTQLELPQPDGTSLKASLCSVVACVPATVKVIDLPANSFYVARETSEVERAPYVRTETITWTTSSIERGIAFAYVPRPFYLFRVVLGPMLGASSASEWAAGLVGVLGAAIAIPLVRPLLVDIAEDKVSDQLRRMRERRKKGTTSRE